MQRPPIRNLVWERNADGSFAKLCSGDWPFKHSGLALNLLASAKMTDVALISAKFGGDTVVFEPWVWILIDGKTSLRFYGAYQVGGFAPEKGTPDLLLRISSWEQASDYERFTQAKDKRKYLLSEEQLTVRSIFTTLKDQQRVTKLIDEVLDITAKGLRMERRRRAKTRWVKLECEISTGQDPAYTRFFYCPVCSKSDIFEAWVSRWQSCFEDINFNSGFIPDEGSRISYNMSFLERLELTV